MNNKTIRISDGNVEVIDNTIECIMPIEEFARKLIQSDVTFETKQLPVNCIKYEKSAKHNTYYIHIPEDIYRYNYNGKLYIVRMPHSIVTFVFELDTERLAKTPMMLWTSDKEIDIDSDTFFVAPLHNVFDSGNICDGNQVVGARSQRDYVNKYITGLFTTEYNDDLSGGKRTMNNVSADQYIYKDITIDQHELVRLWWHTLINDNGKYILSEPMITLHRKSLSELIR